MSSETKTIAVSLATALLTYPFVEFLRGLNGKRLAVMEYRKNQLHWIRQYLEEAIISHDAWELDADEFRNSYNVIFLKKHLSPKLREELASVKTACNWNSAPGDIEAQSERENFYKIINSMKAKVVALEYRWLLNGFVMGTFWWLRRD